MPILKGIQCAYCSFYGRSVEVMDAHYEKMHEKEKKELLRIERDERLRKRKHEENS